MAKLPRNKKVIGCRWVFKRKRDADGKVVKYKARLVAQGFTQIWGENYTDTFAPVGRAVSLRTMLAIAASRDLELLQADVEGAYLNGKIEEEIYMKIPEGLAAKDGCDCVRLDKALYGLKQSGRQWWLELGSKLELLGFKRLDSDWGMYTRQGANGLVTMLVYVDDLLISGRSKAELQKVIADLSKHWKVAEMGEVSSILGLKVVRDRRAKRIWLTQPGYIDKLIDRFPPSTNRTYATPMAVENGIAKADEFDPTAYRELIGSLMWMAGSTRPDIVFATMYLARASAAPTLSHWEMGLRVVAYLARSKDKGISLGGARAELEGWVDSDFGGCLETRRSTTGYLFKLNGSPIGWCSRRQGSTASSTTEAEYVAMSEAGREAVWLRRLLGELGERQPGATTLHCDNQSAIHLGKNPATHQRTKHIDIRHHILRDMVEGKSIKLEYIRTMDQLADIFTKPLARAQFGTLAGRIGVGGPAESAMMAARGAKFLTCAEDSIDRKYISRQQIWERSKEQANCQLQRTPHRQEDRISTPKWRSGKHGDGRDKRKLGGKPDRGNRENPLRKGGPLDLAQDKGPLDVAACHLGPCAKFQVCFNSAHTIVSTINCILMVAILMAILLK
jgi:hypothetical protein